MTGAVGGAGGAGGGTGGAAGGAGGVGAVGGSGAVGGASLFTMPAAPTLSMEFSGTQVTLSTEGIGRLNIEQRSSGCLEDLAAALLLALLLERKNE